MAGQRRQVHQLRRIDGQHRGGLVDRKASVPVDRHDPHVEVVRRDHREVRAVLTGQTCHGARPSPAAQQQVEGVVGAGGVDDVGGRHPGQRRDRGAACVEGGRGGRRGDITAHFGFVPGVLGGGVDDRRTLPRARATVQVQARHRRPGCPPPFAEFRHLVESDSPKSPAGSVHQWVRRRPAAANSSATPSGRNLHDTSVSISSPAAKCDGQIQRRDPHPLCRACPQPHLDALFVGVPPGHMLEGVKVEIGIELAVDHGEHIAIEPGRHARAVVIGADQPAGVLDQVGAQQQGVTRLQRVG